VTSLAALRRTVMIALGSALAFALGLMAAQQAVPIYGELQTLWLTRLISLAVEGLRHIASLEREH
jgi:hypothetical protein